MGTDIAGWVEVLQDTGWQGVIRVWPLVEREYGVFGSLFGVRNEDDFVPAFPSRGVPDDASTEVLDELRKMGDLAVGATWTLWDEIRHLEWDEKGNSLTRRAVIWEEDEGPLPGSDSTWQDEGERWHLRRASRTVEGVYEDFYRGKSSQSVVYQERRWTRQEVLRAGWRLLFQLMEKLASAYSAKGVRLVVWFDSE
jgi:hypothetical protein